MERQVAYCHVHDAEKTKAALGEGSTAEPYRKDGQGDQWFKVTGPPMICASREEIKLSPEAEAFLQKAIEKAHSGEDKPSK